MGKRIYDDEFELFSDLEEELSTSMLTSVDKAVKKVYKRNVEKMYDSYNPTYYQRRMENRGFGDEDNLESTVDCTGDTFEYVMTNETKPVYDTNYRLDEIIESGEGYTWKRHPKARPVYEWTQEELDSSNEIENAIYKDLKDWL